MDLTSEAMSLADEGHHLEAEAKLREAEAVLRQGTSGETRARFVEQKAKLLACQGRFEEASALLIACERWWARHDDLDRRASVVCQRGAVLLSAGQTAVARDLLRGAVEQLEGRVSAVLVWELLHELAIAEVALGERMEAFRCLKRAATLYRLEGEGLRRAERLWVLGQAHRQAGESAWAETKLAAASESYLRAGRLYEASAVLVELYMTYLTVESEKSAEEVARFLRAKPGAGGIRGFAAWVRSQAECPAPEPPELPNLRQLLFLASTEGTLREEEIPRA